MGLSIATTTLNCVKPYTSNSECMTVMTANINFYAVSEADRCFDRIHLPSLR